MNNKNPMKHNQNKEYYITNYDVRIKNRVSKYERFGII